VLLFFCGNAQRTDASGIQMLHCITGFAIVANVSSMSPDMDSARQPRRAFFRTESLVGIFSGSCFQNYVYTDTKINSDIASNIKKNTF
jgi:hypothetical protein